METKIKKFKSLRTIPSLNIELLVVFLTNGRSFYCLCPIDVILNDDNVKEFKVSNTLYEHFLFADFPEIGK